MMKAMNKDGAESPAAREPGDQSAARRDQAAASHAHRAPEKAKLVAEQLLDNALISAGLLDDRPSHGRPAEQAAGDLLIAACALQADAAVLTYDQHFQQVPGLRVVDHLA
jgi:predicted nucleic acid-binding protein